MNISPIMNKPGVDQKETVKDSPQVTMMKENVSTVLIDANLAKMDHLAKNVGTLSDTMKTNAKNAHMDANLVKEPKLIAPYAKTNFS